MVELKGGLKEIFIWIMIVTQSTGIRLQDEGISECVADISKHIFPVKSTLVFSLVIADYEYSEIVHMNSRVKQNFTIPSNDHCFLNKSVIEGTETTSHEAYDRDVSDMYTNVKYSYIGIEQRVLEKIHELGLWTVMVSPMKWRANFWSQLTFDHYILFLKFYEHNLDQQAIDLGNQINLLTWSDVLNKAAQFVVIIIGGPGTKFHSFYITRTLAFHGIFNVHVITQNKASGEINLHKWKSLLNSTEDHKNIHLIGSCTNGTFSNYYEIQPYKFERPLKRFCFFSVNSLPPFVIDAAEGNKDGLDIRLFNLVKEYMGMSEAGLDSSCKEILVQNTLFSFDIENFIPTKYTYGYTLRYYFHVPKADKVPPWASLTRVFNVFTWLAIMFSLIFSAISMRALIRYDPGGYEDIYQCLMNSWAAILGISVSRMPTGVHLRTVFMSFVVYCFCINTVYQAFFISYLVNPGLQHQVDSLEELDDLKFKLAFGEYRPFVKFLFSFKMKEQIYSFKPLEACGYFVHIPNVALCMSDKMFEYHIRALCGKESQPQYHRFTSHTIDMDIGYELIGHSIFQKPFTEIMSRLIEGGFTEKIMSDIVNSGPKRIGFQWYVLMDEYCQLAVIHMSSVFGAFLFGICCGFVTFCLENCIQEVYELKRWANYGT